MPLHWEELNPAVRAAEEQREMQGGCRWEQGTGGNITAGFHLIQAPGAFLQFYPDKRALIVFVDVEGPTRGQTGWFGSRQASLGSLAAALGGGMELCLQNWPRRVQAEKNQSARSGG